MEEDSMFVVFENDFSTRGVPQVSVGLSAAASKDAGLPDPRYYKQAMSSSLMSSTLSQSNGVPCVGVQSILRRGKRSRGRPAHITWWDEDERRTSKQTEQPVAEGTPVVNSRGKAGALGSGRAGGIGARGLRQQDVNTRHANNQHEPEKPVHRGFRQSSLHKENQAPQSKPANKPGPSQATKATRAKRVTAKENRLKPPTAGPRAASRLRSQQENAASAKKRAAEKTLQRDQQRDAAELERLQLTSTEMDEAHELLALEAQLREEATEEIRRIQRSQSIQNDSEDSDDQFDQYPVASAQQPPQEPLSYNQPPPQYNQPPPEQMSIAAAVGRVDPRRALSEQALDLVAFDPALWEDIADWGPQPASQSGKPVRASSAIRPRPSRSPSELDELSDTGSRSRSRSRSPPPGTRGRAASDEQPPPWRRPREKSAPAHGSRKPLPRFVGIKRQQEHEASKARKPLPFEVEQAKRDERESKAKALKQARFVGVTRKAKPKPAPPSVKPVAVAESAVAVALKLRKEMADRKVAQEQEAEAAAQSLQAADTSTNSVLQALARRQRVVSGSASSSPLALHSPAAQHSPPEHVAAAIFEIADYNGNGLLSVNEMRTFLSGTEHEPFMNWLTGDVQVLLEFDGDGDGTISIDELEGAVAAYQQMMQFSSSPSIESAPASHIQEQPAAKPAPAPQPVQLGMHAAAGLSVNHNLLAKALEQRRSSGQLLQATAGRGSSSRASSVSKSRSQSRSPSLTKRAAAVESRSRSPPAAQATASKNQHRTPPRAAAAIGRPPTEVSSNAAILQQYGRSPPASGAAGANSIHAQSRSPPASVAARTVRSQSPSVPPVSPMSKMQAAAAAGPYSRSPPEIAPRDDSGSTFPAADTSYNETFDQLDRDGDGVIDREEWSQAVEQEGASTGLTGFFPRLQQQPAAPTGVSQVTQHQQPASPSPARTLPRSPPRSPPATAPIPLPSQQDHHRQLLQQKLQKQMLNQPPKLALPSVPPLATTALARGVPPIISLGLPPATGKLPPPPPAGSTPRGLEQLRIAAEKEKLAVQQQQRAEPPALTQYKPLPQLPLEPQTLPPAPEERIQLPQPPERGSLPQPPIQLPQPPERESLPQPPMPTKHKPLPTLPIEPTERKPLPEPAVEQPIPKQQQQQQPEALSLERPRITAKPPGGLSLAWDLCSSADRATATHTLYRSEFGQHGERIVDSVAEIGLGSATSFEDDSLKPGTIYGYVLIVSDAHGLNIPSEISYGKTAP